MDRLFADAPIVKFKLIGKLYPFVAGMPVSYVNHRLIFLPDKKLNESIKNYAMQIEEMGIKINEPTNMEALFFVPWRSVPPLCDMLRSLVEAFIIAGAISTTRQIVSFNGSEIAAIYSLSPRTEIVLTSRKAPIAINRKTLAHMDIMKNMKKIFKSAKIDEEI